MLKKRLTPLSENQSRSPVRGASLNEACFAFTVCLLAVVLAYRLWLTVGLFTNPVRPFDFRPADHPVWFMVRYLPYDLFFVLLCFFAAWFLSRFLSPDTWGRRSSFAAVSGYALLHILILTIVLIHEIHGSLLFDVQTGFDYSVIAEALVGVSFHEVATLIRLKDILFILFPFALFWLILLLPRTFQISIGKASFVGILLVFIASPFVPVNKASPIPAEISVNPALFLLSDVAMTLMAHRPAGATTSLAPGSRPASRPASSPVVRPSNDPPSAGPKQWNIVFFIMESVGTRYTFDQSNGNRMPMPFLYQISKEGWHLKRHFTTSNVSTKAVFSLLSGRYDLFDRENLGTKEDVHVPALNNFLPGRYDSFLVTPSSISWYFPNSLIKNDGLPEVHSFENLPFKRVEETNSLGHYIARDENQTLDFFIDRLAKAREPFAGIYISFAAHFPYFDYGPEYRILDGDKGLQARYYSNLNLLDQGIERIYNQLRKQGLLERTILVVVGDHGQAFGQHRPNNFMHYRYSFNENLEAPAFFYQPALFRPRAIETPTSHVDILPTLLDSMRIPYDPAVFDGESLFHPAPAREYLYTYGLEESATSVSRQKIKIQYSLKRNDCSAFDLNRDPGEMNTLRCSDYPDQLDALRAFIGTHNARSLGSRPGMERLLHAGIQEGVTAGGR